MSVTSSGRVTGTAPPPVESRTSAWSHLSNDRVLPVRHPGRWAATALVLLVFAQILHGFVTNSFFQWSVFAGWFFDPVVLSGLVITLKVTALAAVFGLAGGVLLALARLSQTPLLRAVAWIYIWLFRSIPLLVLLLFLNNFGALYSSLQVGVPFGPAFAHAATTNLLGAMTLAVLGFSLNEAAYAAEVVRSGILSVDQGQIEAAAALGLPRRRQYVRIILPQAVRTIVPTYVNQLIGLVKGSSLVYYVSLLDIFGQIETQGSRVPAQIIPLLLVATGWYVVLTSLLSVVQFYVERYYARGALRSMPLTPLQKLRLRLSGLSGGQPLANGLGT